MSQTPTSFRNLEEGRVIYLSPPRIEAMMTGVIRAMQDQNGLITLTYTDGSQESRTATGTISQTVDFPDLFAVVAFVQAHRNK